MNTLEQVVRVIAHQLTELASILNKTAALIENENDEKIKAHYSNKLKDNYEKYKKMALKLKETMDVYFEEEKKENRPVNMVFKKLYKEIEKTLNNSNV